jgi:hypothetical protein
MLLMGHPRRCERAPATSAVTLRADIRLHRNIGREGPWNEPARAGARWAGNGASGEGRANRLIERR